VILNWHRSRLLTAEIAHQASATLWKSRPQAASAEQQLRDIVELTRVAARAAQIDRLVDYLTHAVAERLDVPTAGVATWDGGAKSLVFRGGCGWPSAFRPGAKIALRRDSAATYIFGFGRTLEIEDLRKETRFKVPRGLLKQGAISGLIAPIIGAGRPRGLIGAFSATRRQFSANDLDFFQAAANLLHAAFENDRLRGALEQAVTSAQREAALKIAFIANASHEIRSPLNVILGYCELIGERLSDAGDPDAPVWMAAVERAGARLLGTVEDILAYSRIESGTVPLAFETLRLASVVETVARAATPAAVSKGIGLSCVIDAHDLTIRGDRRCITTALTKLVGNAIKFTKRGAVEISLKLDGRDRARL
jgi:signal transduction histidine kinase